MTKRDYYEILGISKNASDDEIKKAYRKAAVKYHPDKDGGDEAKFKEAGEAYEVLKDSSKRQRYDQFGHAGVGGNSGSAAGGNPFAGFDGFNGNPPNGGVNFDFGDGGLGDIFGQFFGGGNRNQGPQRGRDAEVSLQLSFEEAVFGAEEKITLEMNDDCWFCSGTTVEPGHDMKTCPTCKGAGQVNRAMNTIFGPIQQTVTCETCDGRGKVPEKICTVCHGKGVERRKRTINLKIPAGIDDGATIRLKEHGEAIGRGRGRKGDLYIHIHVKAHKHFTREGDIILSEQHIGMVDATLGTEVDVDTVDGQIRMKVPSGTQSGTDFKLSNHGVPHMNSEKRGPHIVSIVVDTPSKLSKKQRELMEEFEENKKRGIF